MLIPAEIAVSIFDAPASTLATNSYFSSAVHTQHGSIFKTPSGYVQQVPQVSIAQQNLKIMQSFATEFGLTPACRARIVASGGAAESDDDPMAQLLKGGWQDDV